MEKTGCKKSQKTVPLIAPKREIKIRYLPNGEIGNEVNWAII